MHQSERWERGDAYDECAMEKVQLDGKAYAFWLSARAANSWECQPSELDGRNPARWFCEE